MSLATIAGALFGPLGVAAQAPSTGAEGQPLETGASVVPLHFTPGSVAASDDGKWIAMLNPGAGEVYLWDGVASVGSSVFRKVPVGKGGGFVTFKNHSNSQWLIVGTVSDRTLRSIDPNTLAVAHELAQVAGFETKLVPVPDPASPLVYFSAARSGSRVSVATFDVSTGKVAEYVDPEDTVPGPTDLAASVDGRVIYARRIRVMPSGHRAIEVIPPAAGRTTGTMRQIFSEHVSVDAYHVDPATGEVLAGKVVYSPDLQAKVGEIEQEIRPLAFAPDRATVLTEHGALLRAVSTNTWKQQAFVWNPLSSREQRSRQRPEDGKWRAHLSDTEGTSAVFARRGADWVALLVRRDKAAVVDLDSWRVPREPVLAAKAPRVVPALAGQPLSIDVSPTGAGVAVTLDQAPTGAVLNGGTLNWTPGDADIGRVDVKLLLKAGAFSRSQSITVEVRQPSLVLPFAPTKWSLSPDGKTLAILSDRARDSSSGSAQGVDLAVCDLAKGTVGPTRVLESAIQDIATDGTRVFLVPDAQSRLVVLGAEDLAQTASLPLPQAGLTLVVSGQRELVVGTRPGSAVVFDLDTLAPREESAKLTAPNYSNTDLGRDPGAVWSPLGGGLVLSRGRVLDVRTGTAKPVLLTQVLDVERAFPNSVWGRSLRNGGGQGDPLARLPAPWGVYLRNRSELLRADGSTIRNLGAREGFGDGSTALHTSVLGTVPAAVVLRQHRVNEGRAGGQARSRLDLVVHDLVLGDSVATIPLADEPQRRGFGGDDWSPAPLQRIIETGTGLIVVAGDRVYTVPKAKLPVAKLPEPFHFALAQDRLDLPTNRTTKLAVPSRSGSGKLLFELACQSASVQINPATGEVTVDGKKLAEEYVTELTKTSASRGNFRVPDEAKLEQIRARLALLTGVRAAGVPVLLTFRVTARDEKQAVAAIEHSYIVDLSRAAFEKQLERFEEEQKKAIAAAQSQSVAPSAAPARADGDIAALRQRISDLERRNAELEGQVKLLREMLSQTPPKSGAAP